MVERKQGLRLLGGPKNHKTNTGIRSVKMLRPIHAECQQEFNNVGGWANACEKRGHNPYFQTQERPLPRERILSEPDENGRVTIEGYAPEQVEYVESPNLVGVPVSDGHNGGQAIRYAQAKGCRLPEEMGIAPFCQFNDCWTQGNLLKTRWGDYCTEGQAKIIAAQAMEKFLEVLKPQIREEQLAQINVR